MSIKNYEKTDNGLNLRYEILTKTETESLIPSDYVDLANEQTITGLKYFNIRPQIASAPIGTGKNLFSTRWSYGQWTSIGGTGSSYLYFKLPDDTKTYTLSIGTKDTTVNFGSGNVFGITGNGGSASAGYEWLVNGNQLTTSVKVITPSDMRYISLYTKSEETFEALIARYNIQLEEGNTATAYEPWVDPEAVAVYYDVALKPEILINSISVNGTPITPVNKNVDIIVSNQTIKAKNNGTDVTFGSNDAVEIVAGSNVSISANASAKTITISASGGGSGGSTSVRVNDVTYSPDGQGVVTLPNYPIIEDLTSL